MFLCLIVRRDEPDTFNLIISESMPHIPKMVPKKSTFLTLKNLIKPFLSQWLQTASPEILKFIKDLKFVLRGKYILFWKKYFGSNRNI